MQIHRSRQMVSSLLVAFACLAGAREASAQAVTLTGKVQSEQGQPLFGANVIISELNISTGTNEQGIYRVVVPAERQRGRLRHPRAAGRLGLAGWARQRLRHDERQPLAEPDVREDVELASGAEFLLQRFPALPRAWSSRPRG